MKVEVHILSVSEGVAGYTVMAGWMGPQKTPWPLGIGCSGRLDLAKRLAIEDAHATADEGLEIPVWERI